MAFFWTGSCLSYCLGQWRVLEGSGGQMQPHRSLFKETYPKILACTKCLAWPLVWYCHACTCIKLRPFGQKQNCHWIGCPKARGKASTGCSGTGCLSVFQPVLAEVSTDLQSLGSVCVCLLRAGVCLCAVRHVTWMAWFCCMHMD